MRAVVVVVSATLLVSAVPASSLAQTAIERKPQGTFRAGIEAVTVTAAVRDRRGRVVRDLKKSDFEVFDAGVRREIRDFHAGEAPISLAVVLDISGSMEVGRNMDRARHAVDVATKSLRNGYDEAALFTFDATLVEVVPFTTDSTAFGG